jgi:hypothetical protein
MINVIQTRSKTRTEVEAEPITNIQNIEINSKILQDGSITIKDFKTAQSLDVYLQQHQTSWRPNNHNSPYIVVEGLLFRKDNNDQLKLCLPDSLLDHVLFTEHYSPFGQHRSRAQMERNITATYYVRNLKQKITDYTSRCFFCITNKIENEPKHVIGQDMEITAPRLLWSFDITMGLPKTDDDYRNIYVFVEYFSLYTILVPAKTKNTEEILNAFKDHVIAPFSTPCALRSDGEAAVATSQSFKDFAASMGITLLTGAGSSPWTNGQAETKIKTVKALLRTTYKAKNPGIPDDQLKNWNQELFLLQLAVNKTTTSLGYTSEEIMFGNRTPTKMDLLKFTGTPKDSMTEHMTAIKRNLELIHEQIHAARMKTRKRNESYSNQHRRTRTFEEGDIVMIRDNVLGGISGLRSKYTGPHIVLEVSKHAQTAQTENIATGRVVKTHFNHMKHLSHDLHPNRLNSNWDSELKDRVRNMPRHSQQTSR